MTAFAESVNDSSVALGEKLSPYLRAVLAVVLAADVLDLMDSTITVVAAPSIAHELGGGESLVKWLGAGYALAMGVLLVVGGRLGDRYGRRRMFLVGIAGFTLASLACGLAQDPTMLIAARIVQGGFGAMLIPQGIGILTTAIPREQQPRVFFAFGPVLGGSGILGPILAGFIINLNIAGLTWRPIFLINIVLGTAGFIAAIRLLPHDQQNRSEVIDGLGAALLGAAMLALLYGLIQGSTNGWSTEPIACLVAGVASFIAFAIRQRDSNQPADPPDTAEESRFHRRNAPRPVLLRGRRRHGLRRFRVPADSASPRRRAGRTRPLPDDGRDHHRVVRKQAHSQHPGA